MRRQFGSVKYVEGDQKNGWVVRGEPDVVMRLKRMFPRAATHTRGGIILSHTDEVARDIEWALTRWPMRMSRVDRAYLEERARAHDARERHVLEILSGRRQTDGDDYLEPAREPRPYQLLAADLALKVRGLLVGDDLGLGKSMTGLLCLRPPWSLPALIVCPTHLTSQWLKELNQTFPDLIGHVVTRMQPYDPARRGAFYGQQPDVLIMTYSKLRSWGFHLEGRVRTVIFDEAQELRRTDSDKYRAALMVAGKAHMRVGLTATPVYNYGGEIHNLFEVLSPDRLGTRQEFAREWCDGEGWSDRVRVSDPAGLGEYLRGQGLMIRRTYEDVRRELPQLTRLPYAIDSDRRKLAELMDEGVVDLARLILSSDADPRAAFTARGELDLRMRRATGIAKAAYVAEFVKLLLEAEEKVMLFGWHRDVYSIWLRALAEFQPVMYTGTESPLQKRIARARFVGGEELRRERAYKGLPHEEARVFIMSLRSGAGLDGLQHVCRVAVFGELDWSPGMHDQCIGRLLRDGQLHAVLAYFLVSQQGTDPLMADVLNVKRMQSEPLRDPRKPILGQPAGDTQKNLAELARSVLRSRGG